MANRVILCIGTKKGLFVAESPKARRRFALRGPLGAGVAVYAALASWTASSALPSLRTVSMFLTVALARASWSNCCWSRAISDLTKSVLSRACAAFATFPPWRSTGRRPGTKQRQAQAPS